MATETPAGLAMHLADSVHRGRRRHYKRLERCQEKFSRAAVHRLRIETRRILALLHLLERLDLDDAAARLSKRFKKHLNMFDELRDTQVQLRLLKPMWERFPEAAPLKGFLGRREERLTTRLEHKIKNPKYAGLNRSLKRLEKNLKDCGKSSVAPSAASAVVRESFREVARLRRQVRPAELATLHKMRVAFKQFRYQIEQLQPFLPGITAAYLDRLKRFQVAAGDVQDFEVLLVCLSHVVRKRKLNPAALRNLRAELLRRKQQALDSFMSGIDQLFEFEPGVRSRKTTQPRK